MAAPRFGALPTVTIAIVRLSLVVVLALACASQHVAKLSAQFEGAGWFVAYGGGSSLGGALGVTAAVVSPPVQLGTAVDAFDDISDVASNGFHTLIARRNGTVWVMGANDRGQLGLGFAGAPIETLTQIATLNDVVRVIVAGESSYAIDTAGTLWAWGDDSFGQLGIGNPGASSMQTAPIASPLRNVSDVDAGADFAVATTGDGTVWAWGANANNQLGAAGPDRNTPQQVSMPSDFFAIDVAASGQTVLARSFDREVVGWGSNAFGQIANAGDPIDAGATIVSTGIAAMGVGDHHIVMARSDGTVQVRGANWAGQLGNGWNAATAPGLYTVAGLNGVVDVAAGAAHSLAVTVSGEAYGWGFNHMRQLLLPTLDVFSATPQRVMDVPLTVRSVRARSATTILLNDPGALAIKPDVTPPVISSVTPGIATIWPPNRQMVPVTIGVDATDDQSAPMCVVTGVTADEPIDGDWQITAPLEVVLRAERAGTGDGRVYRIAVACSDDAGNNSTASTTVTVPKRKD